MPANLDAQETARKGEEIYERDYRAEYEANPPGRFVAIDVTSGEAYAADQPEEAIERGRHAAPDGVFHLIKVGSEGAFRVSYTSDVGLDRVL